MGREAGGGRCILEGSCGEGAHRSARLSRGPFSVEGGVDSPRWDGIWRPLSEVLASHSPGIVMRNKRFTILIVDDNANNIFTLRALLERQDIGDIVEATSGEAALVATIEHEIHLVLLDVQMPLMDGFETAHHLQMTERTRHIPVVFVTAVFKAEEFRQRGYALGAVDYLTKPIDDNLLLNRIHLYYQIFEREQNLRKTIDQLQQSEARLILSGQVISSMSDGAMVLDAQEQIVSVNPAFSRTTGYSELEAIGGRAGLLKSGRHNAEFFRQMRAKLADAGQWQGEIWNRRKSGEIYPEWLNATVILDEQQRVKYYVCIYSDLSSQEHIRKRLQHLAYYDVLTDLPNRELFQDRLLNALTVAKREGRKSALMFIDLDRFKTVNDTLGHSTGDLLLQLVSQRIRDCLRTSDTLARLGGDEFTVVVSPINHERDAANVAKKIIAALVAPFEIGANTLYVTASIGIGVFPLDGEDPESLLKNADAAMYRAKEIGRNNYQFYSTEMTKEAMQRFQLEAELRQAISNEQFLVYYQPLVALPAERVVGAEALIRWQHPQKGLLTPYQFIKVATDLGLIAAIDSWVIHHACAQFMVWKRAGLAVERIAVNISGLDIERGDLVEITQRVLERYGIAPEELELEVSEGYIMHKEEGEIDTLTRLRDMGVRLAIDDFGTGYSSLSYLKRLPINRLKIDKSFVDDLPDDRDATAIARAVIALAESLQLQVIAEGVEREEQKHWLLEAGTHEVQGYLYGAPMPAAEFEQLLRAQLGDQPS